MVDHRITSTPTTSASIGAGSPADESHASGGGSPPPPSAAATARNRSGIFDKLKSAPRSVGKALRVTGKTLAFTPFFSKTTVKPMTARPATEPTELVTARHESKPPSSLSGKHEGNFRSLAGPNKGVAGVLRGLSTADGAIAQIRTQWQTHNGGHFDSAGLDVLMNTLRDRVITGHSNEADAEGTMAATVSNALLRVVGSDMTGKQTAPQAPANAQSVAPAPASPARTTSAPQRADAALRALMNPEFDAEPAAKRDALALQIALGSTETGMATLLALAPHLAPQPMPQSNSERDRQIQLHGFRHAFSTADHLLRGLPADIAGPASLEELSELANASLRLSERTNTSDAARANPALAAWLHAHPAPVAAKALQAALMLRDDPTAEPDRHLRTAYFNWRCEFKKEGANTTLAQTQQRMYKLLKYVQRSATPGKIAGPFAGFLGMKKSPLSSLRKFGTSGLMLAYPEEEFAAFKGAVDSMKEHLEQQLASEPAGNGERRMQLAARIAVLDQWHDRASIKGLREKHRFSSKDLDEIAQRVEQRLPGQSQGRVARNWVKQNLRTCRADTPQKMAEQIWGETGIPEAVSGKLQAFKSPHDKDVRPQGDTPEAQFDALDKLIDTMRDTYDLRMSSGGTHGIASVTSETLAQLSSHAAVPSLTATPDFGYLRGRHAVIDIGSSAHFGSMFIGTDSRSSKYGGISAYGGWSFAKGRASLGAFGGIRFFGQDKSSLRGVAIRTRRSDDSRSTGQPDQWRAKMKDVLKNVRTSGAGSGQPANAGEMWEGIAHEFYKDPDVSINWVGADASQKYGAASVGATARGGTENTKWGPSFSAGLKKIYGAKSLSQDQTGSHQLKTATRNSGRAVSVSATVVEGMPSAPVHHGGHLAAISFPSVPYVGVGTTMLSTNTNAAARLAYENGRIIPKHSFQDTEFGTYKNFEKYVNHHRAAWVAKMGGTVDAEKAVDTYLSKVKAQSGRGNLIMGERKEMTPVAARQIDALNELRRHYDGRQDLSTEEANHLSRINADLEGVLNDENTWERQSLYVLEALGTSTTAGLSFLANVQGNRSIAGVRELSAMAPPRAQAAPAPVATEEHEA